MGGLNWMTSYPEALEAAKKSGKKVLVDIDSEGWGACKKLESVTFSNPQVVGEIEKDFVAVHVDMMKDPDTASALGALQIPDVRILNPQGQVLMQRIGFIPPPAMLKMIEDARAKAG